MVVWVWVDQRLYGLFFSLGGSMVELVLSSGSSVVESEPRLQDNEALLSIYISIYISLVVQISALL